MLLFRMDQQMDKFQRTCSDCQENLNELRSIKAHSEASGSSEAKIRMVLQTMCEMYEHNLKRAQAENLRFMLILKLKRAEAT